MGELAVSSRAGDELVAIGLGSCIGLAMIDREAGVAGLAHIVLPESLGKEGPAAKFADLAVPELLTEVLAAGAVKRRLEAILIGGARMFSVGASMDIGARNAEAVRSALKQAGVRIKTEETGGNRGRTARIVLGSDISSQLAGGDRTSLMSLALGAKVDGGRATVRARA
ncbi:MAG TPA: chemotaxis protein CheD [Solirubrobacteraceae bacterium]|nr:chemotaxis protein CheD [Solirubrobacteraceae bacterium]